MSTTIRLTCRLLQQQAGLSIRRGFIAHHYIPTPSAILPTRTFSTTLLRKATLASQPEAQPTVLLRSPSAEDIEKEELDVELIPPGEAKLVITDRAAEVINQQFMSLTHLVTFYLSNFGQYQ